MPLLDSFDVVVIGGGHAGAEAARVAARGGARVALVTMIRDAIGRMSCNPAIGGLAKGHLVKEIDALGGLMGEATDAAGIQFKVLNRSKGPAVQGPRAQCDRDLYAAAVQRILAAEPNLTIIETTVSRIAYEGNRVSAVILGDGARIDTTAVIVTTGTFLRALMHSGEAKVVGGRFGEPSSDGLSDSLRAAGLSLGRLKTGTPPRVLASSVDYSRLDLAPGDAVPRPFSILTDTIALPQVSCWTTYTGAEAHDVIRRNLDRAPMFSGQIKATGPRYCPSIEDKVVRFADKERHLVFVEPEGLEHPWLYLNGVSTSLPADVQDAVVRSMPGFERASIARYGYAVEYDFVNPQQLTPSLEARSVEGLFLAGQINGTSGYEEAAAQGLLAGINALQLVRGREPVILPRDLAYAGVMIDDLVTLGTEEPYRMFTSRAEYRLLLGCDSVYERLTSMADALGIVDEERLRRVTSRLQRTAAAREAIEGAELRPDRETLAWLLPLGVSIAGPTTVAGLLARPELDADALFRHCGTTGQLAHLAEIRGRLADEELEGVVNRARYSGYIEKQEREARNLRDDDSLKIPPGFHFERPGLSTEVIEKLKRVQPASLGQAARIPGMTPAAVAVLRINLRYELRSASGAGRGA
ncbi:MAG: tRNA uridine-5-carboxymethylaminomethyl(34) synthesis enzyme MnmG [Acidobacteria bacterium]|nr:tRNA uridine-5-carboxymethylaminomethyl(34) synthesis enzyme MnmG [Acidobacteriota bacterium]